MKHSILALSASCALAAMAIATVVDARGAQIPAQQKAVVQTGGGSVAALKVEPIPVLQPGAGQVLVRVYAAALNPADWLRLAQHPGGNAPERSVAGLDLAGVIVAVGAEVTGRSVGMPVFGIADRGDNALNGAFSQYALVRAQSTAPKPANLTYAEAAGLGVVGVTALRMVERAQIQSGQRVLITGVAGGVGSVAAQIAVAREATVLGTASARHASYLRSIGVSRVIDYGQGNVAQQAGAVDAVLDTVGGDEALDALRAIKSGGHFVSVGHAVIPPGQCTTQHVDCEGSPGGAAAAPVAVLEQVGQLAGAGKLRIHVDKTYPLDHVAEAVQYVHEGHVEGKVILAVTDKSGRR